MQVIFSSGNVSSKELQNMKKGLILALVCIVLLSAGAFGAYWYGNQPVKEYYPNGAIKSITERKLYEPNGKYQLFAQDGTLIEEYNQEKGIKNGKGSIYFKGGSVDFNYANNKLNGPLQFNAQEWSEFFTKDTALSISNTELKLVSGDFLSITGNISCSDDEFLLKTQAFLNEQNYVNFKNLFGCLNIKNATLNADGGKCEYNGSYQFPKFLANSAIKCDETNAEFLQGYAKGFNLASGISSDLVESAGVEGFSAGNISNIENLHFVSEYKPENKKLAFAIDTNSNKNKLEQNGSFGGFEEMIESGIEFAYSPKEENDVKKLVLNILKNMSWSDWSAKINNKNRFTITGDFNVMDGFSDEYVMSYYSNDEVTTQWKFNDKGTQLTSKYPNSNKPMFSFGLNINDNFKKAYKTLVQEGINLAMSGNSSFNQKAFERIQNAGMTMLKGFNSFSGVLMNEKGEKTISVVAALQNNFSIEQFMTAPQQFVNLKLVTYKKNEPERVYEGNLSQGFSLNGKKLSDEELEENMQYVFEILKGSVDTIADELEKSYGNLDEADVNWIDSDVDPFLFGFYKGYTSKKAQFETEDEYNNDTAAEEIGRIADNIHTTYNQNPNGYEGLNNDTIVALGIAPYDDKGSAVNSFGGKIVVRSSAKTQESLNSAFIVALSSIPDDECERFLAEDVFTLPQEDLIGVAVGSMVSAPKGFAELNKLTDDGAENTGSFELEQAYLALKSNELDDEIVQENIKKLCSGNERGNFIAVKYY